MTTDSSEVADGNLDIAADGQGLDGAFVAKSESMKQTLIRTGTKVVGLFASSEGNDEAGDEALVDLELDEQIGITGPGRRPIEQMALGVDGVDGSVASERAPAVTRPSSWMDGHMTKAVATEVIEILQSDADLDAEVAAAIEVTSLLDAVALLAKFDKELAEVESVLVTE